MRAESPAYARPSATWLENPPWSPLPNVMAEPAFEVCG